MILKHISEFIKYLLAFSPQEGDDFENAEERRVFMWTITRAC